MRPRVYVETSVISYLSARPSRDVVVAGCQQLTRDWWDYASRQFELVASQLVVNEASAGDTDAVARRLAALERITLLDATDEAAILASELIRSGAIPAKAAEDAAHIAIAVTNGIDYLVTWNCRHIANAVMRSNIERACRSAGYEPTIICTPAELMEPGDEEEE